MEKAHLKPFFQHSPNQHPMLTPTLEAQRAKHSLPFTPCSALRAHPSSACQAVACKAKPAKTWLAKPSLAKLRL